MLQNLPSTGEKKLSSDDKENGLMERVREKSVSLERGNHTKI